MLELTNYGEKKQDPRKNADKGSYVPRAKHLNFEKEITKVDNQNLQRFGAKIEGLTQKCYTEPPRLSSKRGKNDGKECASKL